MNQLTYQEALDWIHGIGKSAGIRPGLERMHTLLDKMGNPQQQLKCVHIGGTNGKGSTASTMAYVLEKAGYRVGLYTSPYLESFTNRMSINGKDITPQELAREVSNLRPLVEEVSSIPELGQVTEFEVVTALAFRYFANHHPDVVILEVGLGGRLDATNVITPMVSIITNVSREHVDYLGEEISGIAGEKAGIIKEGVPVVTAAENPEVLQVIKEKAREKKAPLCRVLPSWLKEGTENNPHGELLEEERVFYGERRVHAEGQFFSYRGKSGEYRDLFLSLLGDYQVVNAATALAGLEFLKERGYTITQESMREGLGEVCWPGRMELVRHSPRVVLDGAHNPAAVDQLSHALKEHFSYNKLILVLGILKDKDASRMLGSLVPMAERVLVTYPPVFRGTDPKDIAEKARAFTEAPVEVVPEIPGAVDKALGLASPEDLVLICGSLYVVADARKYLTQPR